MKGVHITYAAAAMGVAGAVSPHQAQCLHAHAHLRYLPLQLHVRRVERPPVRA